MADAGKFGAGGGTTISRKRLITHDSVIRTSPLHRDGSTLQGQVIRTYAGDFSEPPNPVLASIRYPCGYMGSSPSPGSIFQARIRRPPDMAVFLFVKIACRPGASEPISNREEPCT